jgi:hypothetical protein
MEKYGKRVHHYHASADAFGGRLQRPFEQLVPVLAPTSLPPVGGSATARHESYRLGDIFSIDVASTQVAGSFDERKGSFSTIVTSVLEGVNVNNVLFADRIVAQITTEHPVDGYFPKVSFIGTQFEGLRIAGCDLEPVLNLDICNDGDPREFPSRSCLYNENFLGHARRQNDSMAGFLSQQPEEKRKFLGWLERYTKDGPEAREHIAKRGNVLCSVVETIGGKCPGTSCGHAIHIPEFGKVYLGELKVDHGTFDLTMVRLEMGSGAQAQVSLGHGTVNGTPAGPP